MLTLVQRIFFGPPSGQVTANPEPNALLDLTLGEKLITYTLATLMLVMGVCPNLWLGIIETETRDIVGWANLKSWVAPDCIHHKCEVRFSLGVVSTDHLPSAGDQQ